MPPNALYALPETGKPKSFAQRGFKARAGVHHLDRKLACGHLGSDRLAFAFSVAPGIVQAFLSKAVHAYLLGRSEFGKLGWQGKRD